MTLLAISSIEFLASFLSQSTPTYNKVPKVPVFPNLYILSLTEQDLLL